MSVHVLLVAADAAYARRVGAGLRDLAGEQFVVRHEDRLSAGLAALEEGGFDVVLLDLELPDSSGLDTFLRLHTYAPRMPVVVLGGPDTEEQARWAVEAGAQDYLTRDEADGESLRWVLQYAVDRAQWLAAEERLGRAGLAFLEHIGTALAESLDYGATAQRIAELLIPTLGDLCGVVLLDEGGTARVAAVAHVQPAKAEIARFLEAHYPHVRIGPLEQVLKTRQPICLPVIAVEAAPNEAALVELALEPDHLRLVRDLWPASALFVPLLTRNTLFGVLCLLVTESSRQYRPQDVTLAQIAASRAAVALHNARLHADLQEALAARDALMASVAHDLRNPLTSLRLLTHQAGVQVQRALPDDRENTEELLKTLAHSDALIARMDGLIQELVDAAHLRAGGHLSLERRPTDLPTLLRMAVSAYGMRDRPVRLETAVAALMADVDPLRLMRVLDNLLSNAVKYSAPGREVVVTLALENGADGMQAVMSVQDQGMGIPAADLPHVFEQFRRATNTEGRIGGSGLGLWGARNIVEEHGGRITLHSQEGVGTTVTVRLPLAASTRPRFGEAGKMLG